MQERTIRVMHVVDVLALAGTEYGVIKLVNRLDPKRLSPMVCCLRFRRDTTRAALDERIPVFELGKKRGRDLSCIHKLADILRSQGIDIVHSHNWPTFFYTIAAAMLAGIDLVVHGEHGREVQAVSWRQLTLSRLLAKRVSRLTTVSLNLKRELLKTWGVLPQQVCYIPNGVDTESFGRPYDLGSLRREFGLPPEDRVVVNVGGVRPVKDHATLVRGFSRLHQKFPQSRLVIVGVDIGDGLQSKIERLASELSIREAVHFTGVRHDIPQLLALADVYVNTSVFEGMSNTVLEAMAARKPVIATRVGGNPELVQEGVTGYLFTPGDDQQLAQSMEKLLRESETAKAMGTAGRAKVERNHSMASMVQANSDLYEEIYDRRRLQQSIRLRGRAKRCMTLGLRWSGLNLLKEIVEPKSLVILAYHRVLPLREAVRYPFKGMVMPRDEFEGQMATLAANFNTLDLPEAIRLLKQNQLPRRAVAVTFDDGYFDNYEYAFPVLKAYQIPATFFIITGAVDHQIVPWWDEVEVYTRGLLRKTVFSNGRHDNLPDWLASLLAQARNENLLGDVVQKIVERLNALTSEERRTTVERLRAANGGPANGPNGLMLTWEQTREMRAHGIHIGSHTVSHSFLDELTEEQMHQEIHTSLDRIRDELGFSSRLFSYPRGRGVGCFQKLLEEAGIEAAVTTIHGRNNPRSNLFQLKRIDAGFFCYKGGFDSSIFEAELRGWFTPFRGRISAVPAACSQP